MKITQFKWNKMFRAGMTVLVLTFGLTLMGCDDVLTIVTVNENGEKVIRSYISIIGDKVYDSTVTLKNWQESEFLKGDDFPLDNLLFKIVNNKENIVVCGNNESAIEISFFDGGYNYTAYVSSDELSKAFGNF
ncbi:MAG: hypothetical protein Ta2F_11900 [Termitinemataceae bacterium]|nr:MAG: hypothetical protein Ta2F_11900 [Termitinemataceae bacterium]